MGRKIEMLLRDLLQYTQDAGPLEFGLPHNYPRITYLTFALIRQQQMPSGIHFQIAYTNNHRNLFASLGLDYLHSEA